MAISIGKKRIKFICYLGFVAGLLGRFAPSVQAHPHIWIDNKIKLIGTKGKITTIDVKWLFDQVYSGQIRAEYDVNNDNKFDENEIKNIQANGFNVLSERNYFAHIFVDNKMMTSLTLSRFSASITDKGVVYDFRLDLPKPIIPSNQNVTIGFYDDEYYVDIAYSDKNGFEPAFAPMPSCKFDIIADTKHPIYGGMFNPKVLWIGCGK